QEPRSLRRAQKAALCVHTGPPAIQRIATRCNGAAPAAPARPFRPFALQTLQSLKTRRHLALATTSHAQQNRGRECNVSHYFLSKTRSTEQATEGNAHQHLILVAQGDTSRPHLPATSAQVA